MPKRDAQPPPRPLPEPEPDEPEEPDEWLDEPVLETPFIGSRVEEEPVEVIDSWSKVLPPRTPGKKSDFQGLAPARRRRAEYDSYTDHLDDEQDHPRRKKGSVAGCFLLVLFLGTLVAGGSYFLFGHEIADWLEVHGYLQYLPEWLRLHMP